MTFLAHYNSNEKTIPFKEELFSFIGQLKSLESLVSDQQRLTENKPANEGEEEKIEPGLQEVLLKQSIKPIRSDLGDYSKKNLKVDVISKTIRARQSINEKEKITNFLSKTITFQKSKKPPAKKQKSKMSISAIFKKLEKNRLACRIYSSRRGKFTDSLVQHKHECFKNIWIIKPNGGRQGKVKPFSKETEYLPLLNTRRNL